MLGKAAPLECNRFKLNGLYERPHTSNELLRAVKGCIFGHVFGFILCVLCGTGWKSEVTSERGERPKSRTMPKGETEGARNRV